MGVISFALTRKSVGFLWGRQKCRLGKDSPKCIDTPSIIEDKTRPLKRKIILVLV